MDKTRVALYIRVSTAEQWVKWVSIDAQKADLISFSKRKWFFLDEEKHIYIDKGVSWAENDREWLNALMLAAKRKEFDLVLVWKIDRFFRKTLYMLEYVEYLMSFWVWFMASSQEFEVTSSSWKMMMSIFSILAELERNLISERTSRWKLMKAEKWYYVWWWIPPLWYAFERTSLWIKLKVIEEEKKLVNRIFELYVKDKKSLWEIRDILNTDWIETKSVRLAKEKWQKIIDKWWSAWTLSNVLRNTVYIWKYYYWSTKKVFDKETNKIKIQEIPEDQRTILTCTPILDDFSLFSKTQELLLSNKATKNNKNPNVFAWLLTCSCGYSYVWYNRTKKWKNYRCKSKMSWIVPNWPKCTNNEISETFLINVCWDEIYKIFKSPDKALEKYYNQKHKYNNIDKFREKIESLDKKIKQYDDWIKKANKDYYLSSNKSDEETYRYVIDDLTKSKNLLEEERSKQQEILSSMELKIEHLNNLNQLKKFYSKKIDSISYEKKIEIIQELVQKITIEKWWLITILFKFQNNDDDSDSDDWSKWLKKNAPFLEEEKFGKSYSLSKALPFFVFSKKKLRMAQPFEQKNALRSFSEEWAIMAQPFFFCEN